MKRILLCIMLISCSIAISAQIQRLFFGLTLGVSTKNSVISYFKNNSIEYHIDDEGTYMANNIKFAGYKWPEVYFYFYKGKLFKIMMGNSDEVDNIQTLDLTRENLYNTLKKKYGNYLEDDTETKTIFMDNKTIIFLFYYYSGSYRKELILTYADKELMLSSIESDESEL